MGEKHGGSHRALLNKGEEDEVEVFGYKTQGFRRALCLAGYVLSCGGLLLLFHWKPEWGVWANGQPCSLEEADVVLLRTTDEFQICTQRKVTWIPLSAHLKPSSLAMDDEESLLNRVVAKPDFKVRSLQVQKIRFAWDFSAREFRKVGVLEDHHSCLEIHAKFGAGLTSPEQELRREICGPNAINIDVTPIWKLLVKEVLHPFYVFQAFSVCLWFAENYTEYAVAIIIMSLLSISLTVYDLRKQSVKLHQLVESHNSVLVKVFSKETGTQEVESRHLVPGDTLILDEGKSLLPCDALLLSGQCIVDEGMLTGESLPITKTSLSRDCKSAQPWHLSSSEDSKRHLLFCGTGVIQARGDDGGPARAVVLRTGFNTAKGDLVRSILYPKPMNFRLYRDAMQFLLCLVVMAGIGMVYAVCVFVINGQEAGEVVKKALDVITIAVPPALPAALTTGIIYTQRRLKKKGIFCISPQRINVCGQLNLICFDKTGTLTEDGLDLWGIVLAEGKSFQEVHRFSSGLPTSWGPAYAAMACCHSLMVLDGKIQGDPLDLKMFEATHWELVDSVGWEGGPASVLMVRPGPEAAEVVVVDPLPAGDRGFHFCLSGGSYEVFSQHFGQLLPQLLLNGTVFARMSPAQKAHLVQQFQQLDYYVGMCGDGANDCGALKEAHAGISLSQQDASVASPFTSKVPTIQCVPELIRHGRAALVTSFCMFKYMALFSLASYIGVLLLYWQLNSFANYQFLFLDLAITTVIGMTMSLNGPHPRLVPYQPPTQLLAPPLLLSVVLNLLFCLAVQLCGFLMVQQQLWYSPSDIHSACSPENATHGPGPGPRAPLPPRHGFQSYENTSVWLLCTFNCLTVALVFSKGKPFREPVYKNHVFMAVLTVQLAVCLFFLFANFEGLYAQMDLVCTPTLWRVWLLGLLLVAFIASFAVEEWLIENRALWKRIKRAVGYQSSSRYKQLRRALQEDSAWPPSDRTDVSSSTAIPLEGPGPTYANPAFVSHEQPCHKC
ncbi:putative cation-transporting ATPase 13A4 isoform 3-T3 [Vipera latastei]